MRVHQNRETHSLAMESTSKDLPPGVYAAIFKPAVNSIRYFFGLKCQSTVHNGTDELVYAIVSNRIMGTTSTTNTSGKVGTTSAAAVATEGGIGFEKKVEKGPTPATFVPIAPNCCHTFNLDSRSYYLTFCTVKETGKAFHVVNEKVPGYNDYVITSKDLLYHVNHELAEKFMEMIELSIKNKKGNVPVLRSQEPSTAPSSIVLPPTINTETSSLASSELGLSLGLRGAFAVAAFGFIFYCTSYLYLEKYKQKG